MLIHNSNYIMMNEKHLETCKKVHNLISTLTSYSSDGYTFRFKVFKFKRKRILDRCKTLDYDRSVWKHVLNTKTRNASSSRGARGQYDLSIFFNIEDQGTPILKSIDDLYPMLFSDIEHKRSSRQKRVKNNITVLNSEMTENSLPEPSPSLNSPRNSLQLASTSIATNIHDAEFNYIPLKDSTYIPWGHFSTVKTIIESNEFFPIYISGFSGNGKTMMVQQACAQTNRECIRIQISKETSEDDLLGGLRLIGGETVFVEGPVIVAAERGAVLLIDELDRGDNKIMCLQGILEGNPILLKRTGKVVYPAKGFNIIATTNSFGRGSEDGKYSSVNVIDEAFLERFVIALEQDFPNLKTEKAIVLSHMKKYKYEDEEFANKLITWSQLIRETFKADGVDELVSTRRICHIVQTYRIFKDRLASIRHCIAKFDEETRNVFFDLYTKIDESENIQANESENIQLENEASEAING